MKYIVGFLAIKLRLPQQHYNKLNELQSFIKKIPADMLDLLQELDFTSNNLPMSKLSMLNKFLKKLLSLKIRSSTLYLNNNQLGVFPATANQAAIISNIQVCPIKLFALQVN